MIGRCLPAGVENHIGIGHGLAGRVVGGSQAGGVIVPTGEGIAFLAYRRLGRIRKVARNGCLVENGICYGFCSTVGKGNGVRIPGIVELGTIVWFAIFRTVGIGKASKRVLILLTYCSAA